MSNGQQQLEVIDDLVEVPYSLSSLFKRVSRDITN